MVVMGDVCKMMKKIKDYIEKWKDSKVYSYQVKSPNIVFLIAVFFIVLVVVDYVYNYQYPSAMLLVDVWLFANAYLIAAFSYCFYQYKNRLKKDE